MRADFAKFVGKQVLCQVGRAKLKKFLLLGLLFLLFPRVDFFFNLAFGDELSHQFARAEPEVYEEAVDGALSHAEVRLVEGHWDVLVNAVADVSEHVLLEGD